MVLKPKYISLACVILLSIFNLSACSKNTVDYPMMGEIKESEFFEGYVGCKWRPKSFKAHAPLKGTLKFNHMDCYRQGDMRPQYGYMSVYYLDDDNSLKIRVAPLDPNYPEQDGGDSSILNLHVRSEEDLQTQMNKFIPEGADENCIIAPNPEGYWQVGFSKAYLESLGYEFLSEEKYMVLHEQEMAFLKSNISDRDRIPLTYMKDVMSEAFFPANYPPQLSCLGAWPVSKRIYAVQGPLIFELAESYFRVHPEKQNTIDPYSVVFEAK